MEDKDLNKEFKAEYMIGSEGGLDYIVIGKHEELSIGIKPVVAQQNPYQIFIGFRVRIHHNVKDSDINVDQYLQEHPTLFAWEKVSEERASSMFGAMFGLPWEQSGEQISTKLAEKGYINQLIDSLSGMFPLVTSMEAIHAFIDPPLEKYHKGLGKKYGTVTKPEGYDAALAMFIQNTQGETN